jgi:hypothetical protein
MVLRITRGYSPDYLLKEVATGRENYYTGAVTAGEPPGRWWGVGAEKLGLDRPGFGRGSVSPRPACRPRADPFRARAGGFSLVSPGAGVNRVSPRLCAAPRECGGGRLFCGLPRALGCPGAAEVSGVKGGPQARRASDRAATLEAGGAAP